jgi:hypothetical protein
MTEDTGRLAQPQQRSVNVQAFGDTMAEIEMAALDKAREYFGEGWRMRIEPSYRAHTVGEHDPNRVAAAGKAYQAHVIVSLVEPEA